jgi:hypothetical protein
MSHKWRKTVPLRTIGLVIAATFCLTAAGGDSPGQAEKGGWSYRHGYYLFLAGTPNGCEDCYIPLLLTRKSIEDLKKNPTADDCVLITTFERDSIWHYDGLVRIGQSEINEAERKVRISNKTYRYQEIGATEILKILENPAGEIPISRPALPSKLRKGPEIKELIGMFRTATPN